jgi:lipoprotein-anchoring transpeptidase ErfK/SrfK
MMKANIIKILVAVFFLSFGALFLFRYWQAQIGERRASDFAIALNHHEEGRHKEAVRKFGKIIESHPGSKEAMSSLYYLGLSLIQLEDYERAIYYFQRLKSEFPASDYSASAIYHWGRAEEERGNLEESFALYESIRRDFSASKVIPNALLGMGRTSEAKKRWEDARSYFQEVIDNFPRTEASLSAKRRLGRLNVNLLISPITTKYCIIYKVSPRDTLESIARRFNTTVELIMKRNSLKSPAIRPLQNLRILQRNFHIVVDVSENILTLYSGEEFIISYPVATGTQDTPTPLGEFVIVNKLKEPEWRGFPYGHPDNILGTRWLGINKPGYGIHGTTLPETIGTHATLGCVRMFNENVEELFDFVPVGTVVRIIE